MANQGLSAPLYQLFASLGLDATPLIEGLADADVDIKKFQALMNDFSVGVGRAFKMGSSEVLAFQIAINQATKVMGSQADAAEYLNAQINNLVASEEKLIGAKKLEAESYLETIRVGKQQADIYRQEEQSRLEYSKLIQQLSQEEVAAYEAARAAKFESDTAELEMQQRLAVEKASNSAKDEEYSRLRAYYTEQEVSSELSSYHKLLDEYEEINEEMTRADLERLAATKEAQAAGSGGAFGRAGLFMGQNGLNPYFRLGESMSGFMQTIQPALDIIFPVVLISLAAEMVSNYGSKLEDVVNTTVGLGKANEDAWDRAYEGSLKASEGVTRYLEKLNEADTANLKGRARDLAEARGTEGIIERVKRDVAGKEQQLEVARTIAREMGATQAQLTGKNGESLGTQVQPRELNKVLTGVVGGMPQYSNLPPQSAATKAALERGETLDSALKRLQESYDDYTRSKEKLDDEETRLRREKNKALRDENEHARKMHDVVHEYSERLPSAMTINPAAYMLQTLGFGPQPVQAVRASDVIGHPPISDVIPHRSYPSSGESYAPAAARGSGGGSSVGGITLSFNINYKFDGIPADVQDFMRNKAEPRLMDDLKLNARGITDKLIQELKTRGVRVG